MRPFDTVVAVDWSARASPSPMRPSKDAVWIGAGRAGGVEAHYHRTRSAAMATLARLLAQEVGAGRRVLAGFDFPLGWPRGFAARVAGAPSALAVWDRLAALVEDGEDNASNRWAVAAALNARFPGGGPFWGCPAGQAREGLSATRAGWGGHGLPERRAAEARAPRAQPGWKLHGAGSVGSQALLGQARLAALRRALPCAVWPFEPVGDAPLVLAEIYPSLLGPSLLRPSLPGAGIRDEAQVRLFALALWRLCRDGLTAALLEAPPEAAPEEGWILGLGFEAALGGAAQAGRAEPRRAGPDPTAPGDDPPASPGADARAPVGPALRPPAPPQGAPARVAPPQETARAASGAAPPPGIGARRGPEREVRSDVGREAGHATTGRAAQGGDAEAARRAPRPRGGSERDPPGAPGLLSAASPQPAPQPAAPQPAAPQPAAPQPAAPQPEAPAPDGTGGAGSAAARRRPALPAGVAWTPLDVALVRLRAGLEPVAGRETLRLGEATGRVLAAGAVARRASPPAANAAVDGWGLAQAATVRGANRLPIAVGRAAAGAPLGRPVPFGCAVRILTGALLPEGVDAVILQEEARAEGGHVAFDGPVAPGANTRARGEDVAEGALALPEGRRLGPSDLALLASLGIAQVEARERLRVGVLSTGDELADPGETLDPGRTYDANRPMLLALLARWGHAPVDCGRARDDPDRLRAALDGAARRAQAILTSGGASSGEEDHVSALLGAEGEVETWRLAIKPGRPLMIGRWRGVPVFGLPGNPVAAFVCALLVARPALGVLGGEPWAEAQGFDVPAGFAKRKRAGRREFLRARLREGRAEAFPSEGSGRVSGLAWAEGLVDLGEGAREIAPGDPVRYLPFGAFGL